MIYMKHFMFFLIVFAFFSVVSSPPVVAFTEDAEPDPTLAPIDVVRIQLGALMKNDHPAVDAGIKMTWTFAHPRNKALTGPINRFAAMIKSPAYRHLIDHQRHDIQEVAKDLDGPRGRVTFAVTIVNRTGSLIGYTWDLTRVVTGDYAGSWMTIGVSQPISLGDPA